MFNNKFIFSKIKFLIFSLQKKLFFRFESGMGRDQGYPISNGYGDDIINFNPSGIRYGYRDILESRD